MYRVSRKPRYGDATFSAIAGLCQDCHGEDSPQATAGLELQQQILRAEAAGERGREGVSILSQAGERTEDEDIRLQAMETHLRELMVVAHTLDPVIVEDLSRDRLPIGRNLRAGRIGR